MTNQLYHKLVGRFFLKTSNILTLTIKKASAISQPLTIHFQIHFMNKTEKTNKTVKPNEDYIREAQRDLNQAVFFFCKSLTH